MFFRRIVLVMVILSACFAECYAAQKDRGAQAAVNKNLPPGADVPFPLGITRSGIVILTSPLEIPRMMCICGSYPGNILQQIPAGILGGAIAGSVMTCGRVFMGCVDLLTLGTIGHKLYIADFPPFIWDAPWSKQNTPAEEKKKPEKKVVETQSAVGSAESDDSDFTRKALEAFKRNDYKNAFKYSMEADQSNAAIQCNLGWMYSNGRGTSKNYGEALKWYRKAAEQGNPEALNNLGIMYKNGKGVQKDLTEAFKWYRKAAEKGFDIAQFNLGVCYAYGHGVAKDESEAVRWYRMAAEQGNVNSQYNLGVCYANGHGVAKDESEAAKWYRKAATKGNDNAQLNLGWMYLNGHGVALNEKEGVKWYMRAAEQGNAIAQSNLGLCCRYGKGVPKSEEEAVRWFRSAAEQGYARAQFRLGACYANGQGVAKDEKEALKWYRKAAAQGDTQAVNALKQFQK